MSKITKTAFLFPGQGSQSIGMGKDLADAFITAREVFEEIDDALDQHLSQLIFSGDIAELTLTSNTQPALMAVSLAVSRTLEAEGGERLTEIGSFAAGHSLGEYSAYAALDSFSLRDTAHLLRIRGDAMQTAVPQGEGAMVALLGTDIAAAEQVTAAANAYGLCEIANDNGANQIVLSGSNAAIEHVIATAPQFGIKRAIKLPVSAPFHSSLMAKAADAMAEALSSIDT